MEKGGSSMNEKLIINTSLLRKESCFEPKPCLVEKVVEMPAAAFARLISRPLDDQYIIAQNKPLMYCDNEFYHCILAVDMHNGDGRIRGQQLREIFAVYSPCAGDSCGVQADNVVFAAE